MPKLESTARPHHWPTCVGCNIDEYIDVLDNVCTSNFVFAPQLLVQQKKKNCDHLKEHFGVSKSAYEVVQSFDDGYFFSIYSMNASYP